MLDLTRAEWESGSRTQRRSVPRRAQQAAAGWEATLARVVFVVSTASLRPVHGDALDATAGGFLTTIGQVGAVELGVKGITVNTVVHGWLEGEDRDGFLDGIPAGRLVQAEEVADADRVPRVRGGSDAERCGPRRRRRLPGLQRRRHGGSPWSSERALEI